MSGRAAETSAGSRGSAVACPHCGVVLDPPPTSSRKCPECREPLVVRTRKGTKLVFTPAGAEQYDRDRKREIAANKARRHAANIGIDDAAWQAAERELGQRFGRSPSGGDVFWNLASQALQDAMQPTDWGRLGSVYFTMALHLKDEGRDYMGLRREAFQCAVRELVAQAARRGDAEPVLRIHGCRPDCQVCADDDGRAYRPDELLHDAAPVPHDCDWCACGVRLDLGRLEQQAGDAEPSSTPSRRSLFGRLFRS